MKRSYSLISVLALVASTVTDTAGAFSPAFAGRSRVPTQVRSSLAVDSAAAVEAPASLAQPQHQQPDDFASRSPPAPRKQPKPAPKPHSPSGIFSPLVLLAKKAMGDERLNKVRAKAISLHSDVISGFVDTSDTKVGVAVLAAMFHLADVNRSGSIDEAELAQALAAMGFDWLKDKQVRGIFERADADHDGAIDLQEWIREAPKTLRTNLIKLAKKNGGELGLLA
jgi:hypothetical protein